MEKLYRVLCVPTLAAGLILSIPQFSQAQVVKTWTYTPGAKKAAECEESTNIGIDFANQLFQVEAAVGQLLYDKKLQQNSVTTITENFQLAAKHMPELPTLTEKITATIATSDKCDSKGQVHLSAETVKNLNEFESDVNKNLGRVMGDLTSMLGEAQKAAGTNDDIFVSQASNADPTVANARVTQGKATIAEVQKVLAYFPNLKSQHEAKLLEMNQQFDAVTAKLGELKAAMYVSEYHKTHTAHVATAAQRIKAGQESGVVKTDWRMGEDLWLGFYLPELFKEYSTNEIYSLDFFIGERSIKHLDIYIPGLEEGGNNSAFASIMLFSAKPGLNIDSSAVRHENLKEFFKILSILTPQKHALKIVLNGESKKNIANGIVNIDLTGQPTGPENYFSKQAKAIDDEEERRERERFFSYLAFENKLNDPKLKSAVEAEYLKLGNGRIKAVKIFFDDDRWTAYVNDGGMALYRVIYFTFIFEDTEGNFYVGDDNVAQDALLGGGFDTKQVTPTFGPFDPYEKTTFKDMWDHNNGGRGMYQLKVSADKIKPYWK